MPIGPDYAASIWPWSCDNTVIQYNEVSGVKGTKDGQGFDSDWNCQNMLIQYSYSPDPARRRAMARPRACRLGTRSQT